MRTAFGLFLFAFHFNGIAHPLHLAVVNMDFKQLPDANTISFRFFADDFLLVLQNKYKEPLELNDTSSALQKLSIQYVTEFFKVTSLNGENIVLSFSGLTLANEMLWLNFSFKEGYHTQGCIVQNSLLFDLYADQVNLLIAAYQGKEIGLQFDLTNQIQKLDFKQ